MSKPTIYVQQAHVAPGYKPLYLVVLGHIPTDDAAFTAAVTDFRVMTAHRSKSMTTVMKADVKDETRLQLVSALSGFHGVNAWGVFNSRSGSLCSGAIYK